MQQTDNKRLFSGIQPTGIITIGNYIGAISNWVNMQRDYDCIFSIVDMHSITVKQHPATLRKHTLELAALCLACGIEPQKSILFIQSHVPAHAELCWVLDSLAYVGEISRMTQFKEKSKAHSDNINMGLMNYPVLMAADILLYLADVVPVGADQKQHLEITRDIAQRFNARYSPTFTVPEPYISKQGGKIMSLYNPLVKMSKSDDNPNAYVSLDDDRDTIIRKFKRCVTDSGNEIKAAKDKQGITNLLTIYCAFTKKTLAEAQKEFEGKNYGDFKVAVAEVVADTLLPIQDKKRRLLEDKKYIDQVLEQGREQAGRIAYKTLNKVYRKIGFYR